ncbi:MAG: hypothetical protein M3418_06155 [Gemmatimonadota bacterium]|nr:hypothetical protein [Gemmatimonadota bacterium]MDQ3605750.1 hypothetical protein [Gemmatimonadota bacterium]
MHCTSCTANKLLRLPMELPVIGEKVEMGEKLRKVRIEAQCMDLAHPPSETICPPIDI